MNVIQFRPRCAISGVASHSSSERGTAAPAMSDAEKRAAMQRVDQVDVLLSLVQALPFGHPDRVRFLSDAERILERRG
jgi:hypothetical protein